MGPCYVLACIQEKRKLNDEKNKIIEASTAKNNELHCKYLQLEAHCKKIYEQYEKEKQLWIEQNAEKQLVYMQNVLDSWNSGFIQLPAENTDSETKLASMEDQYKKEISIWKEKLTKVQEENENLEKNLKEKSEIIHLFAHRSANAFRKPQLNSVRNLCKAFKEVEGDLSLFYADVVRVRSTVEEVKENCKNCKERFEMEKKDNEEELQVLRDKVINYEFLLEQQKHKILRLSEYVKICEKVKECNMKKEDRPPLESPPTSVESSILMSEDSLSNMSSSTSSENQSILQVLKTDSAKDEHFQLFLKSMENKKRKKKNNNIQKQHDLVFDKEFNIKSDKSHINIFSNLHTSSSENIENTNPSLTELCEVSKTKVIKKPKDKKTCNILLFEDIDKRPIVNTQKAKPDSSKDKSKRKNITNEENIVEQCIQDSVQSYNDTTKNILLLSNKDNNCETETIKSSINSKDCVANNSIVINKVNDEVSLENDEALFSITKNLDVRIIEDHALWTPRPDDFVSICKQMNFQSVLSKLSPFLSSDSSDSESSNIGVKIGKECKPAHNEENFKLNTNRNKINEDIAITSKEQPSKSNTNFKKPQDLYCSFDKTSKSGPSNTLPTKTKSIFSPLLNTDISVQSKLFNNNKNSFVNKHKNSNFNECHNEKEFVGDPESNYMSNENNIRNVELPSSSKEVQIKSNDVQKNSLSITCDTIVDHFNQPSVKKIASGNSSVLHSDKSSSEVAFTDKSYKILQSKKNSIVKDNRSKPLLEGGEETVEKVKIIKSDINNCILKIGEETRNNQASIVVDIETGINEELNITSNIHEVKSTKLADHIAEPIFNLSDKKMPILDSLGSYSSTEIICQISSVDSEMCCKTILPQQKNKEGVNSQNSNLSSLSKSNHSATLSDEQISKSLSITSSCIITEDEGMPLQPDVEAMPVNKKNKRNSLHSSSKVCTAQNDNKDRFCKTDVKLLMPLSSSGSVNSTINISTKKTADSKTKTLDCDAPLILNSKRSRVVNRSSKTTNTVRKLQNKYFVKGTHGQLILRGLNNKTLVSRRDLLKIKRQRILHVQTSQRLPESNKHYNMRTLNGSSQHSASLQSLKSSTSSKKPVMKVTIPHKSPEPKKHCKRTPQFATPKNLSSSKSKCGIELPIVNKFPESKKETPHQMAIPPSSVISAEKQKTSVQSQKRGIKSLIHSRSSCSLQHYNMRSSSSRSSTDKEKPSCKPQQCGTEEAILQRTQQSKKQLNIRTSTNRIGKEQSLQSDVETPTVSKSPDSLKHCKIRRKLISHYYSEKHHHKSSNTTKNNEHSECILKTVKVLSSEEAKGISPVVCIKNFFPSREERGLPPVEIPKEIGKPVPTDKLLTISIPTVDNVLTQSDKNAASGNYSYPLLRPYDEQIANLHLKMSSEKLITESEHMKKDSKVLMVSNFQSLNDHKNEIADHAKTKTYERKEADIKDSCLGNNSINSNVKEYKNQISNTKAIDLEETLFDMECTTINEDSLLAQVDLICSPFLGQDIEEILPGRPSKNCDMNKEISTFENSVSSVEIKPHTLLNNGELENGREVNSVKGLVNEGKSNSVREEMEVFPTNKENNFSENCKLLKRPAYEKLSPESKPSKMKPLKLRSRILKSNDSTDDCKPPKLRKTCSEASPTENGESCSYTSSCTSEKTSNTFDLLIKNNSSVDRADSDDEENGLVIDMNEELTSSETNLPHLLPPSNSPSHKSNNTSNLPMLEAMPKAKCQYGEHFTKTNGDLSCNDNQTLPTTTSSSKFFTNYIYQSDSHTITVAPIVKSEQATNVNFLPNFYKEYEPSDDNKEIMSRSDDLDLSNTNLCFLSRSLEQKSLNDFIPQGKKLELNINILRTAIKKHASDLIYYIEKNLSKKKRSWVQVSDADQAAEVLDPFIVNGAKDMKEVADVASKLSQYNVRTILKALSIVINRIVHQRSINKKEYRDATSWVSCIDYPPTPRSRNSAPLHPRIQGFIALLATLQQGQPNASEGKNHYYQEALDYIELTFLTGVQEDENQLLSVFILSIVYTWIARQCNDLFRVRRFVYDVLYCLTKKCLVVLYAIFKYWPAVLPVKSIEDYYDDPIAQVVIISSTQIPLLEKRGASPLVNKLHSFMYNKYKFNAASVDPNELCERLSNNVCVKGVHEAFILLCKKQGGEWFLNRPCKLLMDIVHKWQMGQKEDAEAAAALNILGCSGRSLNPALSEHGMIPLFNLLKDLLMDKCTPYWMQEVIVVNLCRLSRLNWNFCTEVIATWKPFEVSTQVIEKILLDIVFRRSPGFWNKHNLGKKCLNKR